MEIIKIEDKGFEFIEDWKNSDESEIQEEIEEDKIIPESKINIKSRIKLAENLFNTDLRLL